MTTDLIPDNEAYIESHGIRFKVVLVRPTDADAPHWIQRPTVRFYDTRYPHTEHGQHISDYYVDTVLAGDAGINLAGGVPDWHVDADAMRIVRIWLRSQTQEEA